MRATILHKDIILTKAHMSAVSIRPPLSKKSFPVGRVG